MESFLLLTVLIIIIGAFIVKFGELFVALLGVIKYFAIPLAIAKGIKIAFKHEMMLPDCYYDDDPKPKWLTLYGEWFKNR